MGGKKKDPIYYHQGIFANMRELFLRTHKRNLYDRLIKTGKLESHLKSFQAYHAAVAQEMHQRLAEERGVDLKLYHYNATEWIFRVVEIQEEVRAYMIEQINSEFEADSKE